MAHDKLEPPGDRRHNRPCPPLHGGHDPGRSIPTELRPPHHAGHGAGGDDLFAAPRSTSRSPRPRSRRRTSTTDGFAFMIGNLPNNFPPGPGLQANDTSWAPDGPLPQDTYVVVIAKRNENPDQTLIQAATPVPDSGAPLASFSVPHLDPERGRGQFGAGGGIPHVHRGLPCDDGNAGTVPASPRSSRALRATAVQPVQARTSTGMEIQGRTQILRASSGCSLGGLAEARLESEEWARGAGASLARFWLARSRHRLCFSVSRRDIVPDRSGG